MLPLEKKLDHLLVRLLAAEPHATALRLQEKISLSNRPCTIQGIYHELRKLQQLGVVVKVKDTYHLSISWTLEVMNFADELYDNYIASADRLDILPKQNEKKTWYFTNLLRLDDFWVQTMLAAVKLSKAKVKCTWSPHPWFYFAQEDKVKQYYRHLEQEKVQYYGTIGGNTYLDQRYAKSMPSFYTYRLGDAPIIDRQDYYLSVIDSYLFSVTVDKQTMGRIEKLFQDVRSEENMDYHRISAVLNAPAKLNYRVENNPKKAGTLRRKFERYFGV